MSDDDGDFIALSRDFFSRSTVKRFKTVICRHHGKVDLIIT